MSGREHLMNLDLEIFYDHLLLGVGVGRSQFFHPVFHTTLAMSHNQYTRLLAEHGMFGVLAIALLGYLAIEGLLRARGATRKAAAAALLTWGLLFLYVNGNRLAAPSFAFGMAMVQLKPEKREDPQ
jgi:hypothetical protein